MKVLFGSVSASPGKTGKYYYSKFFEYYKIDAEYNPLEANNLSEVQKCLSNKFYNGFNISMPYKQQIIKYLNISSHNVDFYDSCNTIKINNSELIGYNTDINGVLKIVSNIFKDEQVTLLGNGAMGKMFAKVLNERGIEYKTYSPSLNNWESRHEKCDILINCTSLGTSLLKSPVEILNAARIVFDLTMNGNKLKEMCKYVDYFSGIYFYKEVFLEQFSIHTGMHPDSDYFEYLTKINA